MTHPWSDRLSEYADGDLDAADRASLEQHLSSCVECSSGVAELRNVRDWLKSDAVKASDAPSAAEWSAIAQRIAPRRGRRSLVIGAALLAAAAVIVLLIGRQQPSVDGLQPSLVYVQATDDLESLLRDNRSRLKPETVRALESSLAMIDSAIVQAERALAADPANDYVIRYIDRLRSNRLATLRDAVAQVQL